MNSGRFSLIFSKIIKTNMDWLLPASVLPLLPTFFNCLTDSIATANSVSHSSCLLKSTAVNL